MTISRRGFMGMTAGGVLLRAQDGQHPIFRVKVDMVVLSFQVTDSKNHYINGLKPTDFKVYEDGILQRVSTFAEGANTPVAVSPDGTTRPLVEAKKEEIPGMDRPDAFVGANVFVLFDTSNFMYKGFVYAEDAIADFVRGLDKADSVAVYAFSRNLSRAANLTPDRSDAIMGLRKAVAEDEGIPIYVIFTNDVNIDPISSSVFRRIAQRTGGKAYWAKTWQKQVEAFEDIREDMSNSYTITYYPAANPNDGFRKISVEITSDPGKKYRIHSRPGYRPSKSF